MSASEKVSIIPYFFSLMDRAWDRPDQQFNTIDEVFFTENLVAFCNESVLNPFPSPEYFRIFKFLSVTVKNLVTIVSNTMEINDSLTNSMKDVLILMEFLAVNCNAKPTQTYFERQLSTLLSIPCSLNDDQLEITLQYYEKTKIFDKTCFYIQTISDSPFPENELSAFMRRLRRNKRELFFQFMLFPLNDHFFKRNLKVYPDECSARDLYYGIKSRYFSISPNHDVYKILLEMCENTPVEEINKKSLTNPVYVYWRLIQEKYHVLESDFYPYIDKLFSH